MVRRLFHGILAALAASFLWSTVALAQFGGPGGGLPPGGGSPPPAGSPSSVQQGTQQPAPKHRASGFHRFGVSAGICVGVSVGTVVVVKKRLPNSRERAYITVQCIMVGVASLHPVVGPVVVAVILVDYLILDNRLTGPVISSVAAVIEPLFRPLDPSFWARKEVVKKAKKKRRTRARRVSAY